MKFDHKFILKTSDAHCRLYCCNDINAQIDFIDKSCIRVAVYKDKKNMLPTFSINPAGNHSQNGRTRLDTDGFMMYTPEVISHQSCEEFFLEDNIKIELNLNNFLLSYVQNNQLLFCDRAPLAYNFENEFGKDSYHYISRANGEKIFGLGDKGGELNKAGRAFRIETTDCMGYDARSNDPLYKHIPFYICENSVGCYGIFYDTSDTAYIDLGKEINNYYEPYKYFRTADDCLVYYVFFGTKLSILQQFARLCGKQAFPPKWSFDYCASTMAYTDAPDSEKQMNAFLDKVKDLGLSCSGFYLSSGYTSIGAQRYVFNWNTDKFPKPKEFIKHFSDNGIEIIPNIKPAFLCDHPMYNEIAKKGLFVKNPDNTPFITRFWDGNGSYLDFTNKKAFDFWKVQVCEKLLNNGITATWNDNNEFDIKDTDAVACGFENGSVNAERIRSILTYLMVEASYQAQIKKRPDLRPFLSTRSGGIGIRRLAQTWSGDNRTAFSDLRYCHYIGLTMSLSGLYFYGHDLGGFSGDMPSRELLLRWIQHGIFEPRFTIHSWNADGSATMPWSYPDIIDDVKKIFSQRKQLKPYLYNCAYNAVEKEIPINAPLFLYYDDENINTNSNSFMFGRDILVTFVFDEGEEKIAVYLPRSDDWYLDGKLYEGGQETTLTISSNAKMPYFVRSGSIIPTDEGEYGFSTDEKLIFTVYPTKSGEFQSEFFDDDGLSFKYQNNDCIRLKFTVKCTDDSVKVSYKNDGNKQITPDIQLCKGDKRKLIIES
ncbi:MAG: DUF5110 domain-containing protein [Acetobacter sp.]|nr:DUF5110 domain-containing protein [Bacteroides sp.]MCM1340163.1 DUF5110 domain-containing protein [Acetobacter sp.]MCM1432885.1 DUF5110 domain-containing protein [Clostridiales bacterium]